MLENCGTSSGFSHFSRRLVNISSIGSTNSGRSKLPRGTKIVPGKRSRLLVNRRSPQSGQKLRSSPLPDSSIQWNDFGLPLKIVKSSSGTPKKVAVAPPEDLLQSLQWQVAINVGSVLISNLTAPQAHCAVYFLPMSFTLRNLVASTAPKR